MDGECSRHVQLETILQDSNSEPQGLPLAYLKKITNAFADELLLGEGGFGKVYKGMLENGRIVAVKKLFQLKPGLQAKQFENEVYHLMRLKHPNIVRFVGYCYETQNECVEFNGQFLFAEKQQRLLCLEYLSNGSLDGHLSDESSGLNWGTRYKIIKGICCGIHYLHEGCKYQINGSIIHLDLKPANILLNDNMVPKVADFGLSRLFHGTKTETCTTNLAGTFGYMAPEYIYRHVITTKADIYSLGVIIIEIITGDRSDPFSFNSTSSEDFVEAVLQKWRNRLTDAPLETDCNQIKLCLEIGLKCFKVDRNERPTANEIMDSLNGWERRNSVNKHEPEKTNSVDNNGDALPVPDPAADKVLSLSHGRGVAAILSEALFDQMLLHRNDMCCPARGFYTYNAFVAAAGAFPAFGTTGDLDTQKCEIAAFLAQTSHETNGGWLTAPDGPYSWGYCYKEEVNPHSDYCFPDDQYPGAPGKKYHGRGPIQLSTNYYYGAVGQAIGVDLLNNPDHVATDATISFKTAIWFWMTPQPPKPSYHDIITGPWSPSSTDKAAGREPGYSLITNIISGELDFGHGPNTPVDDRIGFYKRYCNILGISYGTNLDCSNLMPLRAVQEITQLDWDAPLSCSAAEHSNVLELLRKLSSQSLEDQRGAAGMLRLLAKRSAENRACIGDAGAIPILVTMLSTIDVSTQEQVVTALLNLSIHEENKARIISSGAVPGIVHVLKRGSMEARENSAATLFSLSVVDENKVTIGGSGAIPALVQLLGNGSLRGKKDAAASLFNLCIYQGNKGKAVRAGLVPILLELLMDTKSGMEDEALAIFAILSSHPEGKAAIGAASAIPVFVGVIRNGSKRNKENAAAVMVHLCNCEGEQQQQHLAEAQEQGIVSLLEELAKSGTDRGKKKAVQLLELMRIGS